MKTVCIFPPWDSWLGNRMFSDAEGCVYTKAFALWREEAAKEGFVLDTCDVVDSKQADILWFMDLPREKRKFLEIKQSAKRGSKLVLQILESPLLFPAAFLEPNRCEFDAVVSFEYGNGRESQFSYKLPIDPEPSFEGLPFQERKLAVMVNTNRVEGWMATRKLGLVGLPGIGGYFSGWKMPTLHWMHPAKGELYSWRRKMAQEFEQHCPEEFDLFGDGWGGQKISWCPFLHRKPNRCHRIESIDLSAVERSSAKRIKLGNYKFVIASENYLGSQGYISEKIFDAILGGSVPVYLGEIKIADFVPKNSFIDASEFHSLEHLVKKLERMSEEEWQQIRSAGKAFLNSNEFQEFTNQKFALKMCYHVKALV
jgi:hypothetical protein